jgi:hypothetical protein
MAAGDGKNVMADREEALGSDRLGPRGDDFYAALMAAHEGLSFKESAALNARLVLLLANQVGDIETLKRLLDAAKR